MQLPQPEEICTRFTNVRKTLQESAQNAGYPPPELIIASKGIQRAHIEPLLDMGHRIFGENRIEEAQEKWPPLRARYPDLQLHLLGSIQSRKLPAAVAEFEGIQTIDRPKIAEKIAEEIARTGKRLTLLVQVNIGEEPQKSGILPLETPEFLTQCKTLYQLPISGLMCIPPAQLHPAPFFALLHKLAKEAGLSTLSMGMSNDYPCAIAYGATQIRVGQAIFGPRTHNNLHKSSLEPRAERE